VSFVNCIGLSTRERKFLSSFFLLIKILNGAIEAIKDETAFKSHLESCIDALVFFFSPCHFFQLYSPPRRLAQRRQSQGNKQSFNGDRERINYLETTRMKNKHKNTMRGGGGGGGGRGSEKFSLTAIARGNSCVCCFFCSEEESESGYLWNAPPHKLLSSLSLARCVMDIHNSQT